MFCLFWCPSLLPYLMTVTPYLHADDGPWNWSETFVIKLWLSHLFVSSWICLSKLSHKSLIITWIRRKLWKVKNEYNYFFVVVLVLRFLASKKLESLNETFGFLTCRGLGVSDSKNVFKIFIDIHIPILLFSEVVFKKTVTQGKIFAAGYLVS